VTPPAASAVRRRRAAPPAPGTGGAAAAAPPPEPVADMDEARRKLAELLGLDAPVSEAVVRAAVGSPLYAMHLLASRHSAHFLTLLLAHPPAVPAAADADDDTEAAGAGEPGSTATLLLRFGKAMMEWGKSGFRRVEPEVAERRLAACAACPHLRAPGGSILRRLAGAAGLDGHSCGLCGCNVSAKVAVATEHCPGADPRRPGFTRWGDPLDGDEAVPRREAAHG